MFDLLIKYDDLKIIKAQVCEMQVITLKNNKV